MIYLPETFKFQIKQSKAEVRADLFFWATYNHPVNINTVDDIHVNGEAVAIERSFNSWWERICDNIYGQWCPDRNFS